MKIVLKDNAEELSTQFYNAGNYIQKQKVFEMFRAMSIIKAEVLQNIRKDAGLNVRTGALLNSIRTKIEANGSTVSGTISSEGVPYARILEEGGFVPKHFIAPKNAEALAWPGSGGQTIFSKGHMVGGFTMQPKPFLYPAFLEKYEEVFERFSDIVTISMED